MTDHIARPAGLFGRRTVIKGAALGAAMVGGTGLFGACAAGGGTPGGGASQGGGGGGEKSADNPFGVDKSKPLEVVIFNGGYGDQYGTEHVALYNKWAGGSPAKMTSTVKIASTLQPRFSGGNPPEVIDNSGADAMPTATLVGQNQLADLQELLDAPTVDDPNTKVSDILLPGTTDVGSYSGKLHALNYVFSMWGWWYSSKLFTEKGWQPPTTWDEFMQLCETIKSSGMPPIIHTGVHTQYMGAMLMGIAGKNGGMESVLKMDNLADDSWTQEPVLKAAQAIQELVDKQFIMPGSEGLDHTTSQAEWLAGKAAMIPVGSWVENEMKGKVPDGFDMKVFVPPSLPGDKMSAAAIQGGAGEPFIVAQNSPNRAGGLEYLRQMLSQEATSQFAALTGSLCAVKDAGKNLENPSTALQSVADASTAAGDEIFQPLCTTWYANLKKAMKAETANLVTGRIKAEQYCEVMQKASDEVKNDPKVPKFDRK